MDDETIFQFSWNEHQSSLSHIADDLLSSGAFVDCGLVAEGRCIDVHKMVLSACSPYLRSLLNYQSSGLRYHQTAPVIVLKDISFNQLTLIVEYMYKGTVSLPFKNIGLFLTAAESLQIRGLSANEGVTPVRTELSSSNPSTSQEAEPEPPQLTPETYAEPKELPNVSPPAKSSSSGTPAEPRSTRKANANKRKPKYKNKYRFVRPPLAVEKSTLRAVQYSPESGMDHVDLTQDDDDDNDEVPFNRAKDFDVVTVYDDEDKIPTGKAHKNLQNVVDDSENTHHATVSNAVENGTRAFTFNSPAKIGNDAAIRSAIEDQDVTFTDGRRVTRSLKMLQSDATSNSTASNYVWIKLLGGSKVESFVDTTFMPSKPSRKRRIATPRKHREAGPIPSAPNCSIEEKPDGRESKSQVENKLGEPSAKNQESSFSSVCDKPTKSQQTLPNKSEDQLSPDDYANGRQLRSCKRSLLDLSLEAPKRRSGGKRKKSCPQKLTQSSTGSQPAKVIDGSDAALPAAESARNPSNADETETKTSFLPC